MSCPGRGAASFTLLRRAGTHTITVSTWTPVQLRIANGAAQRPGNVRRDLALQPGKPRLHRVAGAVEFAQIGQPAHREAMGVLLSGLEQGPDIFRHLGARFGAGGGGAVHQEIVGHHDAIDHGSHGNPRRSAVDQGVGLEPGDRLVGEPDPVHFAALKHLDDDSQQPLVGGEAVGNRAGAAQVIGSNGIGVADRLHIHDPQSALDQHGLSLQCAGISTAPCKSSIMNTGFCYPLFWRVFLALAGLPSLETTRKNKNAPVRKAGPMRLGKAMWFLSSGCRSFKPPAWPKKSQSRYRIWSVQNRSRRCSDLLSVANSSFEMPPTCSTVLTCFW